MINTLTITSLTQGKLFGEKPTVEELDAHGAIIHQRDINGWARNHPVWKSLGWHHLFVQLTGTVRGLSSVNPWSRRGRSWDPHFDGSLQLCMKEIAGLGGAGGHVLSVQIGDAKPPPSRPSLSVRIRAKTESA